MNHSISIKRYISVLLVFAMAISFAPLIPKAYAIDENTLPIEDEPLIIENENTEEPVDSEISDTNNENPEIEEPTEGEGLSLGETF